jgi:hypothetical protein
MRATMRRSSSKILEKANTRMASTPERRVFNLITKGIIDPTKVVRVALENAASIAGLLITTEAMVAKRAEEGNRGPGNAWRWHGRYGPPNPFGLSRRRNVEAATDVLPLVPVHLGCHSSRFIRKPIRGRLLIQQWEKPGAAARIRNPSVGQPTETCFGNDLSEMS